MKNIALLLVFCVISMVGYCQEIKVPAELKQQIREDHELLEFVKQKALQVVTTGLSAGDGYAEVWIRDLNTFIELALDTVPETEIKENLRVFFRLQGEDGNIRDGFLPKEHKQSGYTYLETDLEPRFAGHKNTVETDQETSLVQAVYKYVMKTGDQSFLEENIGDKTINERIDASLNYLLDHRYSYRYGLIWGATTADWGDVQPEHDWGVYLTPDTHYAIDIYDNAMFVIAMKNFVEMAPEYADKWTPILQHIRSNVNKHLWDKENRKYIPHVYLNGSPFPSEYNENQIYYHGGTAVAIEAELLPENEILHALEQMKENVEASGAATIGLTMYPPYPEGFFKGKSMYPYGYQNGGDWGWFGGRMIQQLIKYGFLEEAYEHLKPMVKRVYENDGFYEWYTVDNKPEGSGSFRGEAGVLYDAILMLEQASVH